MSRHAGVAVPLGLPLALFAPPALLAGWLAMSRPADASWSLVIALALLAALGSALAQVSGRARGAWRRALVAVAAGLACALWIEVGLRAAGWRPPPPGALRFGYPDAEEMLAFERDPELFWRHPRTRLGVNELGFLGRAPELPKPAGRRRIVCLGDSCTEQGYPARAAEELNRQSSTTADGRGAWDAVNLATAGYSSWQGRVLAERWLARLEADIASVYFGWNDHWLAFGAPDEEKARRLSRAALLRAAVASSRLLSLVLPERGERPTERVRVPLDAYRANLLAIGGAAERAGARVVLITAPSTHAEAGVPEVLVREGFARDAQSALELHARYNDVVRALARERGWTLLDLAVEAPRHERFGELFTADGIHLTWRGTGWVAERLAQAVSALDSR